MVFQWVQFSFNPEPLGTFDLILGMDWLEAFSPMKIHWQEKWMSITYGASSVILQGLLPETSDYT